MRLTLIFEKATKTYFKYNVAAPGTGSVYLPKSENVTEAMVAKTLEVEVPNYVLGGGA